MKTGWKTSEFWINALIQLVSIAVLLGWISPGQAALVEKIAGEGGESVATLINSSKELFALIAMAWSGSGYAKSRSEAKAAHSANGG